MKPFGFDELINGLGTKCFVLFGCSSNVGDCYLIRFFFNIFLFLSTKIRKLPIICFFRDSCVCAAKCTHHIDVENKFLVYVIWCECMYVCVCEIRSYQNKSKIHLKYIVSEKKINNKINCKDIQKKNDNSCTLYVCDVMWCETVAIRACDCVRSASN